MTSSLSLEAAHQLLKQFDCTRPNPALTNDYGQLQDALRTVAQHSDYQILGICADTLAQGVVALEGYITALGYDYEPQLNSMDGVVYIKFNPKSGLCYASPYEGHHRGVLVSCQSAYADGVNETYGHLPLDLFA
ncbi:DUF1824 family protein [Oscillatoria sp. FACHB-1407]|uniref:DUF1824 family protein n=1 Tax=Oscillatoria sp. FACHB-1407 TaxID=2692847 RepID=UPI00168A390B|nr:DUF1824 family protein [Oscillatoria sp. FACHB-1407]MBD2461291.1 DUF1824 family protein [Oscillatoria sp. FACHB-1407]